MRHFPVSALVAGLALLFPSLAVVLWFASQPSDESSTQHLAFAPQETPQATIGVAAVPVVEPSVLGTGRTKHTTFLKQRVQRRVAPAASKPVAAPAASSADDEAWRLSLRRDELLLAGRLERFDENRARYDERSTLFQSEPRVDTSERAEQDLAKLFTNHEIGDLLTSVDCRETLCRLSVQSSEDSVTTIRRMRDVLAPLGKDRALRSEPTANATGTHYVIYVQQSHDPASG